MKIFRKKYVFLIFLLLIASCSHLKARNRWFKEAIAPSVLSSVSTSTIVSVERHPFYQVDFQRLLDNQTHSKLSAGNRFQLLLNREAYEERIRLIQQAKESIYVVGLLITCDSSGWKFVQELIKAYNRGIDVRMAVDGAPWWALQGRVCLKKLRVAGIPAEWSHHLPVTVPWRLNIHEKYFIVDNQLGITGGESVGDNWAKSNGLDDNFRDTDILIEGPIVRQMGHRFLDVWREIKPRDEFNGAYKATLAELDKRDRELKQVGEEYYAKWLTVPKAKGLCRLVVDVPQRNDFSVVEAYALLAKASQEEIRFQVPSLNTVGSPQQSYLKQAFLDFEKADPKKRKVEVITNGPGLISSRIVPPSLGFLFGWLTINQMYDSVVDTPFHLHLYASWLHSKVYFFDRQAVAVGSLNFDETIPNFSEDAVICWDEELSRQVDAMLMTDLSNSYSLRTPTSL